MHRKFKLAVLPIVAGAILTMGFAGPAQADGWTFPFQEAQVLNQQHDELIQDLQNLVGGQSKAEIKAITNSEGPVELLVDASTGETLAAIAVNPSRD
jgi:hypothetical protein